VKTAEAKQINSKSIDLQLKKTGYTEVPQIQSTLDSISLNLLQKRFLEVNVEGYFKKAENYIQETLTHDKNYRRNVVEKKPLETLIRLSFDKIASAFVLISGEANSGAVDQLLTEYESMVEKYLEETGLLS
jgi:hypothetical protein